MPRRKANVNQADVQRVIRACQREKVPFRVTLQPNGAAVFESLDMATTEPSPLAGARNEEQSLGRSIKSLEEGAAA